MLGLVMPTPVKACKELGKNKTEITECPGMTENSG